MTRCTLELVAAVASNRVIGRAGQLPWHLPDDLKHFMALTMGRPLIMGRRTFESIGRPLPGRRSIVVSASLSEPPHAGVELARSLDHAAELASQSSSIAFVVGGAVLYEKAIPLVHKMHLTELEATVEGDVYFPAVDWSRWRRVGDLAHERDARHTFAFHFRTYEPTG